MITNVLSLSSKRASYGVIAVLTTLFMALPSIVPFLAAHASAENILTRSIQVSDSTPSATGVIYNLTFTPATTGAQSIVVDFCGNTPLIGATCGAVTSPFTAASAALTGVAGTDYPTGWSVSSASATSVVLTGTALGTSEVSFQIGNITNPGTAASNTYFARITTYLANAAGNDYDSPISVGTTLDEGSVALSVAANINVSAAVLETLVFCVSKVAPGAACSGTTDPNVVLGQGTPVVLDAITSDDNAWMQVSSNAVAGVNVYMKNSNACGGLSRNGGTTCDIAPRGATNIAIADGDAFFGMNVGTATPVGTSVGTTTATSPYSGVNYAMDNTTPGNSVSGTYGSLIAQTGSPSSNVNNELTFAASASAVTPAGLYKARMILVAVGTY